LVERIDERVASHAVMTLLSAFFEDYIQRTFKRLTHLLAMKGAGGGELEKAASLFRIACAFLSTSLCCCFPPSP
jgi:urease alpha subunit